MGTLGFVLSRKIKVAKACMIFLGKMTWHSPLEVIPDGNTLSYFCLFTQPKSDKISGFAIRQKVAPPRDQSGLLHFLFLAMTPSFPVGNAREMRQRMPWGPLSVKMGGSHTLWKLVPFSDGTGKEGHRVVQFWREFVQGGEWMRWHALGEMRIWNEESMSCHQN